MSLIGQFDNDLMKYLNLYMIPKKIHILKKLPKNSNGKLDRAGIIKKFTGISDPYEVPSLEENSLVVTGDSNLENILQNIIVKLKILKFIKFT